MIMYLNSDINNVFTISLHTCLIYYLKKTLKKQQILNLISVAREDEVLLHWAAILLLVSGLHDHQHLICDEILLRNGPLFFLHSKTSEIFDSWPWGTQGPRLLLDCSLVFWTSVPSPCDEMQIQKSVETCCSLLNHGFLVPNFGIFVLAKLYHCQSIHHETLIIFLILINVFLKP